MKQTCILVLGMHRSGTSALTGLLSILDVYLGSELMEENFANIKGYFENNLLYKINEKLLKQIDSSWDDVFFDEEKISNIKNIDELKNLIKKEFKYSSLFAIKDPRIAFLLPVYKRALEELGVNVKVIIPFRNPVEVASSLNRRNDFSYEKGMLLWVCHFFLAEKYSREFERVFIDFNELMSNPRREVTLISEKLHINLDEKYTDKSKQINDFLEPGLKHHNLSMDNLSENTPKIVRKILNLQGEFNDDEIISKFDVLREECFSYQKLFYNQDIVSAFSDLKITSQNLVEIKQKFQQRTEELGQCRLQHSETEQVLQQRTEELGQCRLQHSETEQVLQQRTEELGRCRLQHSETEQVLQQRTEELGQCRLQHSETEQVLQQRTEELGQYRLQHRETEQVLQQAVGSRDGQIEILNQSMSDRDQQIINLNYQISSLLNSTSWKVTAGLRWVKRLVAYLIRKVRFWATGKIVRLIYRKLPLPKKIKNSIKNVVFRYAGWLFRGTISYQLWYELAQLEKTKSSEPQIEGESSAVHLVSNEVANKKKKRMLIVDAATPTPDKDSGSLDVVFFMKAFIELGYELTFIPDDLQSLGDYTKNICRIGVRCLNHNDINSIEDFLIKEGASLDVVLLYRVHFARLHAPNVRKYAPQAKIVFDTVDLHFLREERQAFIDKSPEAIDCARYTKDAEFEMMRVADATIVLSSVERDIVLEQDSSINVFEIPYMRDMPGCSTVYGQRRDIVFIGGFLHLPNIDGIKFFVKDIWPRIRGKLKDAKLIILGSYPTDEVLALGSADSRIEVVGFVEDLDPYFNTCRVSIAPLRFGAGIKGKIGTSASYGVPCVATTVAVEGMGMRDTLEVLVADEPEEFSEKLVSLYSDEELWNQISSGSLDFVQRKYSYEAGKERLHTLLSSL